MSLAAGSVTVMAADDVSQRTMVPINLVSVVAVVTVLRPQSAPLSRRRSSASPRSWSSRTLSSGGSIIASSRSRRRASVPGRGASTAAIVAAWSSTTAPMAPQTRRLGAGGAGGRAQSSGEQNLRVVDGAGGRLGGQASSGEQTLLVVDAGEQASGEQATFIGVNAWRSLAMPGVGRHDGYVTDPFWLRGAALLDRQPSQKRSSAGPQASCLGAGFAPADSHGYPSSGGLRALATR